MPPQLPAVVLVDEGEAVVLAYSGLALQYDQLPGK